MKNRVVGVWLLLWNLNLAILCGAAEQPAAWHFPLEIKAGISSTFGEFRGQRVHAGVDLGTNMQTGYKVYAIDDGTIFRLYVQKIGYGNAVYIKHANGLVSVYGHLERFEDQQLGLQTAVRKAQQQRGSKYPGNVTVQVPVKRGQVIGYSGEAGYGLPHLHFEVRNGEATPIDPFKHGFIYEDTTPPVIESLIIQPLGSQAFVDGEHVLREYHTQQRNGTYIIPQIPRIHGSVRFTASAYDPGLGENKKNVDRIDLYIAQAAVNKLEMYIDQNRFFSNQFNQVTYSTDHRGGLVYDFNYTRLSNPTQYYYRLYTLDPARFPFREVVAVNNGVWDTATVAEGRHTIALVLSDANGNQSTVQMQVQVEHQPNPQRNAPALKSGWQAALWDFQDFLEVVCQTSTPLRAAPSVHIERKDGKTGQIQAQDIALTPGGINNLFTATYDLTPGQDGEYTFTLTAMPQTGEPLQQHWVFPVHTIFAKQGGVVRYGESVSMSLPAGALYETTFVNIFPTTAFEVTDGLPVIGEVYDFRPAGTPLEKKGVIRIRYPDTVQNPKTLGIFWWDAIKKTWYFMDDQIEAKTRMMRAEIIYPSVYAILHDTVKPVISELVPESGSTVAQTQAVLSARITDIGKGIAEDTIMMTLDGKRVNGEYDPDRSLYKYPLTGTLAPGKHTLQVQAADKAGNQANSRTSQFIVQ